MKFSKAFLLAVLMLPATTWAMESDGFELWKQDYFSAAAPARAKISPKELEFYANEFEKAPQIYSVLVRAAAKKLGVPADHFDPIVGIHIVEKPYSSLAGTIAEYNPERQERNGRICVTGFKNDDDLTSYILLDHFSFPFKKFSMLHEMGHISDPTFFKGCDFFSPSYDTCRRKREIFAEAQTAKHLKCIACARAWAFSRKGTKDYDVFFKTRGYFTSEEILSIAEKTYDKKFRCPYHQQLACLTAPLPHIQNPQIEQILLTALNSYLEARVAEEKLDVF